MTTRTIDLNCDLGEDPARAADGSDAALLGFVTSANIACGGHAGDDDTMSATILAAMEHAVAIGAHPSFPDRARFGRVDMDLRPAEIEQTVFMQIDALAAVVRRRRAQMVHVKPHGALYHAAMTRRPVADAIARAVARVDPRLILIGLAGAPGLDAWRATGLKVAAEAFADRRYEPDGSLRSRMLPGAVLADPAEAAAQALRIAQGRGVPAGPTGAITLNVRADTICIHSDSPDSLSIARAVRFALEQDRIKVAPLRGSQAGT